MFQGIGDKVSHIAHPTRLVGGLKQGIGDSFLHIESTVTHHIRGPPAKFEKGLEIRFDSLTVPGLAEAQANDVDLFERQGLAPTEGRDRNPEHNESLLGPNLHRKIADTNPLLIEVTLSLL